MTRALAIAVFVVACDGNGIAFEDFDDEVVHSRCAYLTRCGLFPDDAACRAYYDRTAIDDPNPQAALDAGKLSYDDGAARSCLDALAGLSCDSSTYDGHELDVCDDVFTGKAALGAACAFDSECTTDSCVVPDCGLACCTGQCGPARALPGIGQPCGSVCVDGAMCGLDATCHAALPAGAACTDPLICETGMYCAGWTSTSAGACAVLPRHGAACVDACALVGDTCKGVCVSVGLPGDPCASADDCSSFYLCDATQHCAAYPTRGMPCQTRCSDDSWCNAGACDAPKANGATCMRNDECVSHYCDGTCTDVPLCF